jgi:hypothetical protein
VATTDCLDTLADVRPRVQDPCGSLAVGLADSLVNSVDRTTNEELELAALDEISDIVGTRQSDVSAAEGSLEEFVMTASPDCDVALVQYFHRWTERQQFLIRGTGALHERLIHISPQPLEGIA